MSASEDIELTVPRVLYLRVFNGSADMPGNPWGSDDVTISVNGTTIVPSGTIELTVDEYAYPVALSLPAGNHQIEIQANSDRTDGSFMFVWAMLSDTNFE